ncbi:ROK family protein [Falsirhodobacter algicola]|uniref:ROK family protein n=1 Tax=Falsirhodobacter algicola TaxID=2692330 RepID=A0A8J8MW35_9RHOB|nr:ROK family transcriptional regulator [Falsirhodobacter algicola]QUS37263.1 ROK family protein [Falsirhodobacter algicola]
MSDNARPVPMLRQISTHAMMRHLVRGPRSRADLARDTGLSKQTTSDVIRILDAAGWVRELGLQSTGVGRSPLLYCVNPDAGAVLGADIGASRVVMELSDASGARLASHEARIDSIPPGRLIDTLLDGCSRFVAEAAGDRPLRFACFSTPGIVEPGTGRLSNVRNLPDLTGADLPGRFSAALGCSVVVENDVNSALVGESWCGAANLIDDVAYVGLGTGVGMGLMMQGRVLRGANGAAGEIASLPIGADSRDAEAPSRGTLERVLGVRAILAPLAASDRPSELIAEFGRQLDAGDPEARAILERIGSLCAQLVLSIQAIVDPQAVIMGGMLGLVPGVVEATEAELAVRTARPVRILRAGLGLRSTITGAGYIALTGMYNSVFSPHLEAKQHDSPWPIAPPPRRMPGAGS